jgi:hypothetical protein
MAANVEKRLQRIIPITRNDYAFTRDLAQKIVARRRNLVGSPGADPGFAVEALELVAEEIGVGVVAGRQSRRNELGVRSRHSALSSQAISNQELAFVRIL